MERLSLRFSGAPDGRLTCWGYRRLGGRQAEAVVDVGRQQVVAAVLVLVALQVLVDLVDQ